MTVHSLVLPDYHLLEKQPKVPHRSKVEAEYADPSGRKYVVRRNLKGSLWWVSASNQGMPMSGTIATTVREKGQAWASAVRKGHVSIEGDTDRQAGRTPQAQTTTRTIAGHKVTLAVGRHYEAKVGIQAPGLFKIQIFQGTNETPAFVVRNLSAEEADQFEQRFNGRERQFIGKGRVWR